MATRLTPYIMFGDSAREALEFYHSVFGGELVLGTFGEAGMPVGPGRENHVMHGMLESTGGLVLMGADTPSETGHPTGGAISLSLSGEDLGELQGYWVALCDGGTVTMPFAPAPWGDTFGMLVDRFGVEWMVNVAGPGA